MPPTKKKRRSKHRGNAAGMVEARGRTGRKPDASELRAAAGKKPAKPRVNPMDREPSWKGSMNRAAIATVVFFIAIVLLFKQDIGPATGLAGFMFLLYIPMGYYTDLAIYRRRQRKKQLQAKAKVD